MSDKIVSEVVQLFSHQKEINKILYNLTNNNDLISRNNNNSKNIIKLIEKFNDYLNDLKYDDFSTIIKLYNSICDNYKNINILLTNSNGRDLIEYAPDMFGGFKYIEIKSESGSYDKSIECGQLFEELQEQITDYISLCLGKLTVTANTKLMNSFFELNFYNINGIERFELPYINLIIDDTIEDNCFYCKFR